MDKTTKSSIIRNSWSQFNAIKVLNTNDRDFNSHVNMGFKTNICVSVNILGEKLLPVLALWPWTYVHKCKRLQYPTKQDTEVIISLFSWCPIFEGELKSSQDYL